jgi:hypothetical protein
MYPMMKPSAIPAMIRIITVKVDSESGASFGIFINSNLAKNAATPIPKSSPNE